MKNEILEQANHNFEASETLLKLNKFPDWVITTAFYSVIYYVESKMFPHTENFKTFDKLDEYARFILAKNHHAARRELVSKKLPSIKKEYIAIETACHTARYTNYQAYNQNDAKKYFSYLEIIKNCILSI